jgi:uncharacterized protein YdeI (YjbR/CyaY-like superfamily)
MKTPDSPHHFHTPADWRAWLEENHEREKEAWLVIRRAESPSPGIFLGEAVEEALCFGWIDGVMKSVDAETYFLRFSPRKRGSIWSVSNQQRVERLIEQDRMTESGMAKVREARENGEWEAALRREDTLTLPDDLREALAAHPQAQANFDRLAPSHKKQYLYWIASARTAPTRQKRIQQTVEMVASGKRLGAE